VEVSREDIVVHPLSNSMLQFAKVIAKRGKIVEEDCQRAKEIIVFIVI